MAVTFRQEHRRRLADRIWKFDQVLWALALPALVVLKLIGVIAWSWWWVLAPLWICGIILVPPLCLLVAGIWWNRRNLRRSGGYPGEDDCESRSGGPNGNGWTWSVQLPGFGRSGRLASQPTDGGLLFSSRTPSEGHGMLIRFPREGIMVDDEDAGHLAPEVVLADGGWNRDYARVLLIEEYRGQAIVLVDGNGDGAELELEYWNREGDGGWAGGSSSGHSSLDALGRVETWVTGMHVAALGKAAPGSTVSLTYSGITYSRQANEFGIWGFIVPVDPDLPEELPVVAP